MVVGQSMGGMIATAYGRAHPEVAGIVNIDGTGQALPSSFPGAADETAARHRLQALLQDGVDEVMHAAAHTKDRVSGPETVERSVAKARQSAKDEGMDPEVLEAAMRRGVVPAGPGGSRWRHSCGGGELAAMLTGVLAYDTLTELHALECPALFISGSAIERDDGGLGEDEGAFRAGMAKDLDEFAQGTGRQLASLPTLHMVHLEMPRETATLVHAFAVSCAQRATSRL